MIQDIRQCIIILKNFEKEVEELLNKCTEVKKQHIEDTQKMQSLQDKIEELEEKLKVYEQRESNQNSE